MDPRTITVTGAAQLKVVPDEVVIIVGIESHEKTLAASKMENDDALRKVLAAARKAGLDERSIATDHLSVSPVHHTSYHEKKASEFSVSHTVVLTLREVSKFEALLTAVLDAGANHVHGVTFGTSELRKHRDQARALALRAAKEKATAMAAELGEALGRVQKIDEGEARWWSPYGFWGGRGLGAMQNVTQQAGGAPESVGGVAPGTIAIEASVKVTFSLA
jgi:uncharacterized protein YggE